jgi:hypothetical protein
MSEPKRSAAKPSTAKRSAAKPSTAKPSAAAPAEARRSEPRHIDEQAQTRDIAEVPAVEVITTVAVHLMSAAAVKLGLADNPESETDLDEARKLITALAGLVTSSASEIGDQHARPLRDGLRSLQLAFREASTIPDAPGAGPGEKLTGPVN